MGVWRADLKVDPRTNVSRWTVIYKVNIASGVCARGFIDQNFVLRRPFLSFLRTYTFCMNPTHCFINKTPDPDN